MPKATDYINHMVEYIDNLVQKGFAYEKDGDVYFRVLKSKSTVKLVDKTSINYSKEQELKYQI